MKCPHCSVEIHEAFFNTAIAGHHGVLKALNSNNENAFWNVEAMTCPNCAKAIIQLAEFIFADATGVSYSNRTVTRRLIHPKSAARARAPAEVPKNLAEDFNEACLVIADSPKASAALSRRCLQGVLHTQGYDQSNLASAIDAILKAKLLPSVLATSLDAIRNIGNFAAHPIKDTHTDAIVAVETDEADWNLDVLEGLFDYFFVLPAKEKAKIDALNIKLRAAGKPPIREPDSTETKKQ